MTALANHAPPAFHLLAKPSGAICNLDCQYCFFLSKEELYPGSRFRMTDEVLEAYIQQILAAHQTPDTFAPLSTGVTIAWQGGEPTLMGLEFFQRSVDLVEKHKKPGQTVNYTIQTNGTRLDDAWAAFFKEHNFLVGLSIDGPQALHDVYRVDKGGAGSFDRVMDGWQVLSRHEVDVNILCTVHAANADHPVEVYRFFRDELGAKAAPNAPLFIQFIPIVERATPATLPQANRGWNQRPGGERPLYTQEGRMVTQRSVRPKQYGAFLIGVFEEWVRRDVGEVYVQIFDVTLGSYVGQHQLCIFAPTCGTALALEHNGDLYSCDHFVEPDYLLGSILETPMIELVASDHQRKFGLDKRDSLPRYCRDCEVRFACHGGCPRNRFIQTPADHIGSGEEGLNYLCAGYKLFFHHVDRPMRIMADLLSRDRAPSEIVGWYAAADARLAQTIPVPAAAANLSSAATAAGGKELSMKNEANNDVPVDVEGLEARSGDLRAIQDYLEDRAMRNVAQVAYSTDGRTFGFEAPLSLSIPVGSFVQLKAGNGREYLGQIITKELVQREGVEISLGFDEKEKGIVPEWVAVSGTRSRLRIRALEGSGVLLGQVADNELVATSNVDIFQKATITPADMALVDRYMADPARKRASLLIGHALYVDGHVPVALDAGGLNRHTFLCGQSGSGKTFSLGIVLERLLLETDLRLVIIDPNSDFVRFDRVRPLDEVNRFHTSPLSTEAYTELAARYQQAASGLRIFRPAALATRGEHPLRLRFGDLSPREQGTVLDLDPLEDREEFNAFWQLVERLGHRNYSWDEVREAIGRDYTAQVRQLGLRIENLGIAQWEVWCPPGEPSLLDALGQEDWRGLVLDIGTLGSSVEKSVIANATLTQLWQQRNRRQPLLIVIDEAHNLCPQEPANDMQAISTEAVIRIAGEGRKFGLYLLLASQRPNKIHSNILSQCDNLLLMRMNSHSDLAHLASILSQVPTSLMEQATQFSIGESLLAGRIVQNPTFAKFEGRLSVEGGGDIPTTWAARRKSTVHPGDNGGDL